MGQSDYYWFWAVMNMTEIRWLHSDEIFRDQLWEIYIQIHDLLIYDYRILANQTSRSEWMMVTEVSKESAGDWWKRWTACEGRIKKLWKSAQERGSSAWALQLCIKILNNLKEETVIYVSGQHYSLRRKCLWEEIYLIRISMHFRISEEKSQIMCSLHRGCRRNPDSGIWRKRQTSV